MRVLRGATDMRRLHPQIDAALRAAVTGAAHGSDELRRVHRLHAVLLVSVGRSCYEVAQWFGEHPRSIERWVHAYELHGVDGLRGRHGAGRPTRLTLRQRQQLGLELAAEPACSGYAQLRWSGKLLARHLARRYGVQLSPRSCQRLIRQLGP